MAIERILLVLGNSVSLPPPEAVGAPVIPYPALLRERLKPAGWRVEERSSSGATVAEIERTARNTLPRLQPAAVVIQLGIVDCAPRPLRPWERRLLERLQPRRLRDRIVAFLHEHRAPVIRRRGLIQKTDITAFREHFRRLLDDCLPATSAVAILPIFPATGAILARNPRLAAEIDKYNDAMSMDPRAVTLDSVEVFGAVSIEDLSITPESVHLNQRGHDFIARAAERWLFATMSRTGTE